MPPQTIAHYNGTLQWHHSLCPHHSTLQWHLAMAPRPLPKVGRHLPPTTIAHYNGNLQWHPTMAPRPIPQSWSSPSPPTTAHYNGTLYDGTAMAPRPLHPAMAPWCHVQSAKVVRRPPPVLEVRTPIAIAIWGKSQGPTPNLTQHPRHPTPNRTM